MFRPRFWLGEHVGLPDSETSLDPDMLALYAQQGGFYDQGVFFKPSYVKVCKEDRHELSPRSRRQAWDYCKWCKCFVTHMHLEFSKHHNKHFRIWQSLQVVFWEDGDYLFLPASVLGAGRTPEVAEIQAMSRAETEWTEDF